MYWEGAAALVSAAAALEQGPWEMQDALAAGLLVVADPMAVVMEAVEAMAAAPPLVAVAVLERSSSLS